MSTNSTSTTARDAIIGKLSRALGPDAQSRSNREGAVAEWRERGKAGPTLRPERASRRGEERRKQFKEEATRARSEVLEVASLDALPRALADYLRGKNAGGPVRIAPHPDLGDLDWTSAGLDDVKTGRAEPDDAVSVSVAASAAAETGSVAFVGGPESPTTLHVLPLHHVSVVYASRIEAGYEDALAAARTMHGPDTGGMPRHLNVITGPSRTADIEQTLLMGAHGPQNEVVVIVDDR